LPGGIADWRRDLAMIAQEADEAVGPVVVCGDFNATVWHRALRPFWRNGFVDAHVALGDRWSRSWPAGRLVPRLARLDHALVRELVPRSVTPVPLPGSDHDGFVVELGLVRSAERVELAP
jgi:endonuclease/exonuclease/phosphatase (EEP) superfamily protein YafD